MKKLILILLFISSLGFSQTTVSPVVQLLNNYTSTEESDYAIVLAGLVIPNGGAIIYNTTTSKVRMWNGSAFIDSPSVPPSSIASGMYNSNTVLKGDQTFAQLTGAELSLSDITTNNATTGMHGFLPKLGGGSVNFLRADGTWTAPTASAAWGSITGTLASQTDLVSELELKAPLTSPTLVTPILGVATATTINGATITSGTLNGTVTGTNTGDQTISDATISTTDITTNNASSTKHGFLPKLSNVSTEVLSGIGTWVTPSGSGDMVLANIQTVTGAKTFNAGKLILGAGSTALAPLTFTSGTNLTSVVAGTQEYDGVVFYSNPTINSRGVALSEHFVILSSTNTLTSQTGAQPIFDGGGGPTNGRITLPVGTYEFECLFTLSAMSATSGSFGFSLTGTATKSEGWTAVSKDGVLATAAAPQITYNTTANVTLCTASTATVGVSQITGIIRVTVAGTIIPNVSLTTAAAAVVGVNSFFRIRPIGSQTVANVGNWD